jgi:putative FmdB family regulatory protein
MARYLYFCEVCQKEFEIEKTMALAGKDESCPKCQKKGQRIFTAPGISIKGGVIKTPGCSEEKRDHLGCSSGCCHGSCSE